MAKLTKKEQEDKHIPKVEDFSTIDAADLLMTARNRLRGLETDKANVMMVDEPNREARLVWFDEQIEQLRDRTIPALEKQVPDEPDDG